MASVFTKIINGEIPCYKVAENEKHIAFLDINPVAPGHTLIVPKKEIDYIFDMTDEEYVAMQLFAKRIAKAMKKALPCRKIGVTVIGLEVPHAHIHLVPLTKEGDMNFNRPKLTLDPKDMDEMAKLIAENIDK